MTSARQYNSAISIHALREEGDCRHLGIYHHQVPISIHALREEGDTRSPSLIVVNKLFLSTPSVRRATWLEGAYQYQKEISIHALREEGDNIHASRIL